MGFLGGFFLDDFLEPFTPLTPPSRPKFEGEGKDKRALQVMSSG
jgi:hypothetical protein